MEVGEIFLDSRRQVTYIILIRLLLVVMNSVSMSLMRHYFQFLIDFSSEEKKQTYHHHKKPLGFFSQRFFQPLLPFVELSALLWNRRIRCRARFLEVSANCV